jgi:CheY-like chemotaxis protein
MQKRTILWADDDPDDLMLMRQVLEEDRLEYDIVEVHNGREALDYLEAQQSERDLPCLLILDMNMPVLNGRTTLTLLKQDERFSKLPVVIFTTSNSELDKMFCKKFQVEMITKPPTFSNFREVIKKLLTYCAKD